MQFCCTKNWDIEFKHEFVILMFIQPFKNVLKKISALSVPKLYNIYICMASAKNIVARLERLNSLKVVFCFILACHSNIPCPKI